MLIVDQRLFIGIPYLLCRKTLLLCFTKQVVPQTICTFCWRCWTVVMHLGVVHNYRHLWKRTQRTLFDDPLPPPQKRTLKCWFFSKSYLLTATCTIYTTHWSFHIYVNIIINKTIDIKNIHLFIIKLHAALHRSTLKRVKMHVASATCEGPL